MNLRRAGPVALLAAALTSAAVPGWTAEVNVYSHRQPELIQPLADAFTRTSTGSSRRPRRRAPARPPTWCSPWTSPGCSRSWTRA